MSKLVLSGDTSGSITLDAPAVSGTTILTLPTTTDTLVGKTTTDTLTNKTLTSPVIAGTPTGVGVLTNGTAVASTSGTSIDFTGIPSWVKRITVMFQGVSTSGTSVPIVQIGDSGGVENTGYLGAGIYGTNGVVTANYTTGFPTGNVGAATHIRHGIATITLISGNIWCFSSQLSNSDVALVGWGSGSKSLSDVLDRVRITTVNGTDTFDAGSINIMYE
jgi:hypothetical protein